MRNVGIFYAYWCTEWDADYLSFIKKVKDLGYDQLELNGAALAEMAPSERQLIVDEAKKQNISLLSFSKSEAKTKSFNSFFIRLSIFF